MKRFQFRMTANLFACCVISLFVSSLSGDDGESSKKDSKPKHATAEGHLLKPLSKDFNRLSSLAGTWKGKKKDEVTGKLVDIVVEYRLTSGNSALVETLMKDSPDEMISVYHDDNNGITMTHYCGLGNQPRMNADKFVGNQLNFKLVDGSNMESPKEMHMGALRLTLVDDTHIRHQWELFVDEKPVDEHSITMEFQRVSR